MDFDKAGTECNQLEDEEFVDNATILEIGENIVKRHLNAFKELAEN